MKPKQRCPECKSVLSSRKQEIMEKRKELGKKWLSLYYKSEDYKLEAKWEKDKEKKKQFLTKKNKLQEKIKAIDKEIDILNDSLENGR